MRRTAAAIVMVAVAAVALLGATGSSAGGDQVRLDAVFDSAKGLVPGQVVKVAGSEVGSIEDVYLVRTARGGYRARLRLAIDSNFVPFRSDASCRILPQGLLSENYVDCNPGNPQRPELAGDVNGVPTVAVERTSLPTTLQDLLRTFSMPTSQRLAVLLGQLGVGTAGRGADLNALLRRANPALAQIGSALSRVNGQRRVLRAAIGETDRILQALARDDRSVRQLVTGAATVAETTSVHRVSLGAAVRDLPPALDALDATLPTVERTARDVTPLLRSLRRSAPALNTVLARLDTFTPAANPALRAVGRAAASGRNVLAPVGRLVGATSRLARESAPAVHDLDRLLVSARDSGFYENWIRQMYGWGSGIGTYGANGHMIPITVTANPRCIIAAMQPGTQTAPRCGHSYREPGRGQLPRMQTLPSASGKARATVKRKSIEPLLDYLLR